MTKEFLIGFLLGWLTIQPLNAEMTSTKERHLMEAIITAGLLASNICSIDENTLCKARQWTNILLKD